MADKIILANQEQLLYNRLCELITLTEKFYTEGSEDKDDQNVRYEEMASKAHELHMKLKARGCEPKHHKYMYKNRRVPADEKEFYNHLHPTQDLIAFINNPNANDDPADSTLGVEFEFRIYTRRWGHYDTYTLMRTDDGWKIKGAGVFMKEDADKGGNPVLFEALQHDGVSYPYNIDELLKWLWHKASEGAEKEDLQKAINDLAEWISICEKSTPRGIFEGLL